MRLEESTITRLSGKMEGTAATKPTTSVPHFRKLEELIVLDMEMAKDQTEYLSEIGDPSEGDQSEVELTDGALAQYASTGDSVTLKKTGYSSCKASFSICHPSCRSQRCQSTSSEWGV